MVAKGLVNKISYLHLLMETVPLEITDSYFLYQINWRFMAEAQYGGSIISLIERGTIPHSFGHTIITKSNNRVCAMANALWKPG
jgi:medium-chain acyl-[acyl-carrier-protein] hydrolase